MEDVQASLSSSSKDTETLVEKIGDLTDGVTSISEAQESVLGDVVITTGNLKLSSDALKESLASINTQQESVSTQVTALAGTVQSVSDSIVDSTDKQDRIFQRIDPLVIALEDSTQVNQDVLREQKNLVTSVGTIAASISEMDTALDQLTDRQTVLVGKLNDALDIVGSAITDLGELQHTSIGKLEGAVASMDTTTGKFSDKQASVIQAMDATISEFSSSLDNSLADMIREQGVMARDIGGLSSQLNTMVQSIIEAGDKQGEMAGKLDTMVF